MLEEAEWRKIEILLHEYDSLRNETLYRYNASFQAIGVFAVALFGLVAAISTGLNGWVGTGLIAASAIIFIAVMVWIDFDTARASRRVREIEAYINERTASNLLEWETRWGAGGICAARLFPTGPLR